MMIALMKRTLLAIPLVLAGFMLRGFAQGPANSVASAASGAEVNLAVNSAFEKTNTQGTPDGYVLEGNAVYRKPLANARRDASGAGIVFDSTARGGAVSQTIAIDPKNGRAFAFRFRGLPQDEFSVGANGLTMKVEFFGNGGSTAYDGKVKELFPIIEQARRDLSVNGDMHVGGAAVWRDYVLTFYVPFPQVDRVKLTISYAGGGMAPASIPLATPSTFTNTSFARGPRPRALDTGGHEFLITDFRLAALPEPAAAQPKDLPAAAQETQNLISLGGRWFYAAKPGETAAPALFDRTNADRLLYRDGPNGECELPFYGNMTAKLRAGDKDTAGNIVTADRIVADNVTVRFDSTSMIIHTRGVPNHPTGRFPESGPGSNPSYIQEQDETFYIPLVPKENPNHFSYTSATTNYALNMGPIGVAANGVVFFNPFDMGQTDATSLMDRCCGHPNQDGLYHYHKYPICLNSPWSDEGTTHSPLLGWAFDGFPIYGPYESENVMAKDETGPQALNAFNMHYDAARGWHYHVTPGKFPYLIGGYWGVMDARNVHRPPRGNGSPPPGGPPPF